MGKTIVLTGAGGVLCGKLAEALAQEGHKIAVLDLRMEAADAVVVRIKANGGNAIGQAANVLEKDISSQRALEIFSVSYFSPVGLPPEEPPPELLRDVLRSLALE